MLFMMPVFLITKKGDFMNKKPDKKPDNEIRHMLIDDTITFKDIELPDDPKRDKEFAEYVKKILKECTKKE